MGLKGYHKLRFGKSLRRLLAAGAALAVLSGTLPALPAGIFGKEIPLQVQAAESTTAKLRSLKIDRAYILEPTGDTTGKEFDVSGYSPDHFTYEATVYRSYDEVNIYPFVFKNGSASVKVNGQTVDGVDDPYRLSVPNPGMYSVEVSVTEGSVTNVYTIQVEKVNTDYRQRKPVVTNEKILNEMKVVETSDGTDQSKEELLKVLKLNTIVEQGSYREDQGVYWKPANSNGAYFVVDLGDVYDISRIRACVLPRNMGESGASIWVSSENVEWEQVDQSQMKLLGDQLILTSNTQWHQDVNRYEFESQPVRYIKWQANTNVNNLQIHQFMIYEDTAPAPQTYDPPADGSIPWEHEERHQYLASGQATVIERGFPLLGWMPSDG